MLGFLQIAMGPVVRKAAVAIEVVTVTSANASAVGGIACAPVQAFEARRTGVDKPCCEGLRSVLWRGAGFAQFVMVRLSLRL